MIFGIGTDVVEVSRIHESIEKFGDYLQHAEHYYRIMAAAAAQQAQYAAQQAAQNPQQQQPQNGQPQQGNAQPQQQPQNGGSGASFSLTDSSGEEEGEEAEAS